MIYFILYILYTIISNVIFLRWRCHVGQFLFEKRKNLWSNSMQLSVRSQRGRSDGITFSKRHVFGFVTNISSSWYRQPRQVDQNSGKYIPILKSCFNDIEYNTYTIYVEIKYIHFPVFTIFYVDIYLPILVLIWTFFILDSNRIINWF